jgi:hypothetical protein
LSLSWSEVVGQAMRTRDGVRYANGRTDRAGVILTLEEAVGVQISINSLFDAAHRRGEYLEEVRVMVMDWRGPMIGDSVSRTTTPRVHEMSVGRLPTPIQGKVWMSVFGVKVVVV